MSLSADEFQLNSKSAYIPECIHKCINYYECTSIVIRDFSLKKNKKNQQDLYKNLH